MTTTTTSNDAPAPSGLQKVRDDVLSFGVKAIKFLLLAIFLLAELCSVPKISRADASSQNVREEMDALLRAGSAKELEFDIDSDLELYRTMMTFVTSMKIGDFTLEGSKAQEFWTAYAPAEKSDTTLSYIRFRVEENGDNRVLLRYSNGISSEITMEFDDRYLCKTVLMRYGVFNGNIFSWIYWNLIGRFIHGYPCYVTEADTNGSRLRGDVTLKKYTVRNQVFSWSFSGFGKTPRIENITGHWVSNAPITAPA